MPASPTGGGGSQPQPLRVREQFSQDEQQGFKAKTIASQGGRGNGGQMNGILEQILKLDGNKSGAIKPAIDKLKKLKDIQSMTDGAGMNGMLGQMMSNAMKAANKGGSSEASATAMASLAASANELPGDSRDVLIQAIVDMVNSVNGRGGILFLLRKMRDACQRILGICANGTPDYVDQFGEVIRGSIDYNEVIRLLHVIADCGNDIVRLDSTLLNESQVSDLFITFSIVIQTTDRLGDKAPQIYKSYGKWALFNPFWDMIYEMDFRYLNIGLISAAANELVAFMNQSELHNLNDSTSVLLQKIEDLVLSRMAAPGDFTTAEEVMNELQPMLNAEMEALVRSGNLSVGELRRLLEKFMDMANERAHAKVLDGTTPSNAIDNVASQVPVIGQLISDVVKQHMPKFNYMDQGKMKENLQKHARQAVIAEKMIQAIMQGSGQASTGSQGGGGNSGGSNAPPAPSPITSGAATSTSTAQATFQPQDTLGFPVVTGPLAPDISSLPTLAGYTFTSIETSDHATLLSSAAQWFSDIA